MDGGTGSDVASFLSSNLHSDILLQSLQRMYTDRELTDCILVAGDDEIHAHKVVLWSSSSYLKKLLEKCSDKVPLIVFSDLTSEELRMIVGYIYFGKVSAENCSVDRIVKIATDFKIEGLIQDLNLNKPPANGYYQSYIPQNDSLGFPNYSQPSTSSYNYPYVNMDQCQHYTFAKTTGGYVNYSSEGIENVFTPPPKALVGPPKKATPRKNAPKVTRKKTSKPQPVVRKKTGKVLADLSNSTGINLENSGEVQPFVLPNLSQVAGPLNPSTPLYPTITAETIDLSHIMGPGNSRLMKMETTVTTTYLKPQ